MPARDPHIMAVGAVDHDGSASTLDDEVADFTNGGSAGRRPDLLAPGKSVVSLRVPSSYVDLTHPEGRLAGDSAGRFFRGSGTSQAAAVVAGEAALLFQANPNLTPDQVKAALLQTARPLTLNRSPAQGAGVTDVGAAVTLVKSRLAAAHAPRVVPGLHRAGIARGVAGRRARPRSHERRGAVRRGRRARVAVEPPRLDRGPEHRHDLGERGLERPHLDRDERGRTGRCWPAPWTGASWSGLPWVDHVWSDDRWEARSWRGDDWEARSWREDSWEARSWRQTP